MHKENVLRMSHKGFLFFLTITQFKESTFWDFFCMLILIMFQMPTYLMSFYR
jgi:hypothetical protein